MDRERPFQLFNLTGESLPEGLAESPSFERIVREHWEGGIFTFPLESHEALEVRVIPRGEKRLVVLLPLSSAPSLSTLVAEDRENLFYRIRLQPELFFEYVSPSVETLTGYTVEEHYLHPELWFTMVHPADRKLLEEILEGKRSKEPTILRFFRKDRQLMSIEHIGIPVHDTEGRIIAIEGIARRAEGREFEELLEHMLDAFVVHEGVFDESGRFIDFRILYINKAYEEIVGVSKEEVLGRTARELWPDMEEEWFRYHAEVATTGTSRFFELYHKPTGKYYRCRAYRPFSEGN